MQSNTTPAAETLRATHPTIVQVRFGAQPAYRVMAYHDPGMDYPVETIHHFALFSSELDARDLVARMGKRFAANLAHWRMEACDRDPVGCTLETVARPPCEKARQRRQAWD